MIYLMKIDIAHTPQTACASPRYLQIPVDTPLSRGTALPMGVAASVVVVVLVGGASVAEVAPKTLSLSGY